LIGEHAKRKQKRKLEEAKDRTLYEGNVLKYYDLYLGRINPFQSDMHYIRIMEVREGWVLYEEQIFEQIPGRSSKLKETKKKTMRRDDLYNLFVEKNAVIVKNNWK
jgi:hypothetical protein